MKREKGGRVKRINVVFLYCMLAIAFVPLTLREHHTHHVSRGPIVGGRLVVGVRPVGAGETPAQDEHTSDKSSQSQKHLQKTDTGKSGNSL